MTHLPQVAACANNQFLVSKSESRGTTRSSIEELDAPRRVEEIARMLGGIKLTATTRRHAREMLQASAEQACKGPHAAPLPGWLAPRGFFRGAARRKKAPTPRPFQGRLP